MPRKVLLFLISATLFIIIALFTQLRPQFLTITKITCQLNNQTCPSELTHRLESLKNKSLLFSRLETDVLQLDLNLYQLESTSKLWPNTIVLNFSYKPNNYIIKTNQDALLVSENGLTQPISIEKNLPLIEVYDWQHPIQKNFVDSSLHDLNLNLVQLLAAQEIPYQYLKIKNFQEIEIILRKNLMALVQKDQLETQIIKLAIILDELDLNEIDLHIKLIDLRFNFPLLKTEDAT